MTHLCRLLAIASFVVLSSTSSCLLAQFDSAKSVVIEGPAGYSIRVEVTASSDFFGEEQRTDTTSSLKLTSEPVRLKLDEAYSSFRVSVFSPTKRPLRIKLVDGDEVIEEVTTERQGVVDIKIGDPPAQDGSGGLNARLGREESRLVTLLREALVSGGPVAPFVSENEAAAIDTAQLTKFFGEVSKAYGVPKLNPHGILDGWLAWDGARGARILKGPYFFTESDKPHFFSLLLVNDRIVDLEFDSDLLPRPWLTSVGDTSLYEAKSLAFAEAVFSGRSLDAESLLGEELRKRSDPGKLAGLSQKIRRQYGLFLSSQKQDVDLQPFDSGKQRYVVTVRRRFEMSGKKTLIGSFVWQLPSEPGKVGRGELIAFDFYEPWSEKDRQTYDIALNIVGSLTANVKSSEETNTSNVLWDALNPRVQAWSSKGSFLEFTAACRSRLGELTSDVQPDNWFCRGNPGSVYVGGVFHCSKTGRTNIEMQFSNGSLVNLKIAAPQFAATTSTLISQELNSLSARGEKFWVAVLSGETEEAFEMLSEGFKQQLSIEQFAQMLPEKSPQLVSIEKTEPILWDSTKRQLPCMLTSYYLAQFEDDTTACFRTNWGVVPTDAINESESAIGSIELFGFSSDFEDRIFLPLQNPQLSLLAAVKNRNHDGLKSLADEEFAKGILNSVLDSAIDTAGISTESKLLESSRMIRSYGELGNMDFLQTDWTNSNKRVRLNARFLNDKLKFLEIKTIDTENERPIELSIAANLQQTELVTDRGKQFLQLWCDTDFESGLQFVAEDIRSVQALQGLTEFLNSLKIEHGLLTGVELVSASSGEKLNEILASYQLHFAEHTEKIELTFLLKTTTAEIIKIQF